jgi:hypothetical protein
LITLILFILYPQGKKLFSCLLFFPEKCAPEILKAAPEKEIKANMNHPGV